MRRRQFVGSALAAASLGLGTSALAHPPKKLPDYGLPPEMLPKIVSITANLAPY